MTDFNATNQQPMSDDQELAKVLSGVSTETDTIDNDDPSQQPIETTQIPTPVVSVAPQDSPAAVDPSVLAPAEPVVEVAPETTTFGTVSPDPLPVPSPSSSGELDDIKKDAIVELRPLVDKLSLAPDEKFDTYLLLLRSTDDKELIAPAHEAAKSITDETRRAQALLDIIKEIDYLSGQQQAA